jgi:hypothetical protein
MRWKFMATAVLLLVPSVRFAAAATCTSTCEADGTCVFDGLLNTPQGNAELSIDDQCRLNVGGIGGSGLDGVIQSELFAPFMATTLAVPNFSGSLQGTTAIVRQIGIADGDPGHELSFLRFVNFNGSDIRMDVNCLEIGATRYSLEIYLGETLVDFQELGLDPPVLFFPREDLLKMACGIRPDGDVFTSFQLKDPQPIAVQAPLGEPGPFLGDFVIVNGMDPVLVPSLQTDIDSIFINTGTVVMPSMFAGPQPYTFDDVRPDHSYFDFVEALAGGGATAGCSTEPPLFCPDDIVSRAQAIAMILRALGIDPDSTGPQVFDDVPPSHPLYGFVQVAFKEGLTAGCSSAPPLFCPDQPLPRWQTVVLLLKAMGVTPASTGDPAIFDDVPPSLPYFDHVQEFAGRGLTAGCSAAPPLFCPDQPVRREQMAVFLVKALLGPGGGT